MVTAFDVLPLAVQVALTLALFALEVGGLVWIETHLPIALAGVSLAVGLWWCYFTIPFAAALSASNARSMVFGFGHVVLYASIAATGADLHAAAYLVEHHSELDAATWPTSSTGSADRRAAEMTERPDR